MKHTILFLAANPEDTSRLDLQRECAEIETELSMTASNSDFNFRSQWCAGIDEMMRALNWLSPAIVHFSGHGDRDPATAVPATDSPSRDVATPSSASLLFHDDYTGEYTQRVQGGALAGLIASASPDTRLVVLNACHSVSVAESLRRVVDCAIGFGGTIKDTAAHQFSVALYRALGHRKSIGNAVQQATAVLEAKRQLVHRPICYTRDGRSPAELFVLRPATPDLDRSAQDSPASAAIPPSSTAQPTSVAAEAQPAARVAHVASPTPEQLATALAEQHRASSSPTRPASSAGTAAGTWRYDVFVIHPAALQASGRALRDLLQPDLRVCLAARGAAASEHRGEELAAAQRASRATVLMLSSHADAAWYLGSEVIATIKLHRGSRGAHPLLGVRIGTDLAVPSSLAEVAMIDASDAGGLDGAARRLRGEISNLPAHSSAQQSALEAPSARLPIGGRAAHDPFQLYERLCRLGISVFDQIVERAEIDPDAVARRPAALHRRALDVAQLAALDPTLYRRVAGEIERLASWVLR